MIHNFSPQATNKYFEMCRKFDTFNPIVQAYKSYIITQISFYLISTEGKVLEQLFLTVGQNNFGNKIVENTNSLH